MSGNVLGRGRRLAAITVVLTACSAGDGSQFGGGDGGAPGETGSGGELSGSFAGPSTTTGGGECTAAPGDDTDGDGFTGDQGDCNDCDANVNPAAIEVATDTDDPEAEQADENCDGDVDEEVPACDDGLALDDGDAMNAARALELCHELSADEPWGVTKAAYVRADGTPATPTFNRGLLEDFGSNPPRRGARMLGLSSGHARDEGDANACAAQTCSLDGAGTAPTGFPQGVPDCPGGTNINDDIALEVELTAPSNAEGFSFDFVFTSFEYPEWVCTTFNDQFIALVTPPPMGSINGNVSFDSQTNPVSVNIALFEHCDPAGMGDYALFCSSAACPTAPSPYCPQGTTFMDGTGFQTWGDGGSTGWLVTTAPVKGGETVSVRFAIWDTGDTALDSTVLVDNFQWVAAGGTGVNVGTTPVPE